MMTFEVSFNQTDMRLNVEFSEYQTVQNLPETYTGDYAITPTVTAQVIPTKNRYLTDDMTVKEIPYYETSNTTGGNTVYIANVLE